VEASKWNVSREADCGIIGSAEPLFPWRRPMSTSLLWNSWMSELPGVVGDGMSGWNGQRKPGTTRGWPRRSRTAKASHISRRAMKLRCAREWGGWGRLSGDGPGQHNPDRSEGPWSMAVFHRAVASDSVRGIHAAAESTKDGGKPDHAVGMLGASLTAV
jgi:hypothetical protein